MELEQAYRRVKTGKATGEDGIPGEICKQCPTRLARMTYALLFKQVPYSQEAPEHKGGRLALAWKRKGPQSATTSYRSLLVSSQIGEPLRRALCQKQGELYHAWMQCQQLGGRSKTPVSLAMHMSRAYHRRQKQFHRSSASLYLDLTEAFYRVIRQFAVGGEIEAST